MTREDRKPSTLREPAPSSDETQRSADSENSLPVEPLFTTMGGSLSDDWNTLLGDQVLDTLPKRADREVDGRQCNAAVAGLIGIGPKDELEGMMAAQLIAVHNAAMDCLRRAAESYQSAESRGQHLAHATKLSRALVSLVEALNRHRGKGQQKVTVEHVHVHAGGQAVVGVVDARGGGDQSISEVQPHAKQIGHAPKPAVRRKDEVRDGMPFASDAERAVPDARRRVARRTKK